MVETTEKPHAASASEAEANTTEPIGITVPNQPKLRINEHPDSAGRWPNSRKLLAVVMGLLLNTITSLASSLPGGATEQLKEAFAVADRNQQALPLATFFIGFVFGPVLFGPLSESYGRKVCLLTSFTIFAASTLACALAPNWWSLLLFRVLVGLGASAPQSVLSGLFSDVFPNLQQRGKAIALLTFTGSAGPFLGPIVGAYITEKTTWPWIFWINLILTVLVWPLLILLPETYEPVILRRMGLQSDVGQFSVAPITEWKAVLTVVLTRPLRMLAEPIVLLIDIYVTYIYLICYIDFELYPTIFKDVYDMSTGESALMLLPIALGAALAGAFFFWYDHYLERAEKAGKSWASSDEYRRLPLACVGAPMFAVSQFWLAWSAKPHIHWTVPAISGIVMGFGIEITAMALVNYLTDAYGIFSASAMASQMFLRSVVAAVLLPTVCWPLYDDLGLSWAYSVLGFFCVAMVFIPFLFIKYGPQLRERSKICQQLKESVQVVEIEGGR